MEYKIAGLTLKQMSSLFFDDTQGQEATFRSEHNDCEINWGRVDKLTSWNADESTFQLVNLSTLSHSLFLISHSLFPLQQIPNYQRPAYQTKNKNTETGEVYKNKSSSTHYDGTYG